MIPKIRDIPILFLSGLRDQIVPPSHMKTLFDLCETKIKVWRDFPEGSHNDTVAEEGYFEYIEDFISKVVLGEKDPKESTTEKL